MKIDTMKAKLEAAGFSVRVWNGFEVRLYVKLGSRALGYVTEADASGSTGTCKNVQRSGSVAAALRG